MHNPLRRELGQDAAVHEQTELPNSPLVFVTGAWLWRFAARVSGLASGLALAVRPAGPVEVSRVNGVHARPSGRSPMQPQRRA